ncbi:Stk1 family PASTA domain-containing Ser/Thr kinase [Eubacterium sp.]|uniref:Stk1 family PASTA domain-containing Ser/Thr kinase n=1 Tax=Eubacterium sp. TaxID=142586 RepID=UPI002608BDCC|nr:Stk1 family PASTA domain-containing Ser/Thr kinase [Eubacterium sp.]MDD7331898.1 Stk1 family PASTA domain-containing Ser/Thr kinase [Eubacterium sp.]
MDNYVGKRLDGRYEVQEIIGVGGMSVVYKAYDNVDDRIVAIKILKDEFLNNEEFKRRFKNESKAIALLSHENIVRVYDVNFGEKLQYIVMEYIDGITLKEYINKQNSITWNDAVYFMTQILRAVQHAHDKGIVHRDIKPQNIILLPNGTLKVTDFGIARFSRSETKTLTEQAIGSVHYIAPEQAKGEQTDERADIYSMGVVLYEMLAGKVPFDSENAVSVALMQVQANAEKLTQINPNIPKGLEQICVHAMQKNPDDRYQSATEMLLDIEEIIKNPNTVFNYASNTESQTKSVPIVTDDRYNEEYDEAVDYEAERKHKKKMIAAVTIGVIVLIAAVVGVIYMFTSGINTKTHTLENFVGYSYDELQNSKDYKYEFVAEYQKTDEKEPGIILSQSPEAGSKITEGSTVTLVVAASEKDITMPNVYGLTLEMAEQTLKQSELSIFKAMKINSDTVEEGKVIYTDPKANSIVSGDQEITIYVSDGPSTTTIETIKVPDVIGLTKSGAREFLTKYGFTNVEIKTQDSTYPKDVVISQSPSVGSSAKATDKITVIVSTGVTTTEPQTVDVTLDVLLPKIEGKSDTLTVELDGKTYTSTNYDMDGSKVVIKVTVDANKSQNIRVSLKKAGETKTENTDGKDKTTFTVDFSRAKIN